MIEKAPLVFKISTSHEVEQRDADHQHYTEGKGRKQIHQEEVQQFVKEINNILGICSERSPRWRAVVLALESLLQQAGEK